MGVLVEGETVVIRNATVEQRFPGGIDEYERRCPNSTFCTDGQICRVGFMVTRDAVSYIAYLESLGFVGPAGGASAEVVLVSRGTGHVPLCDWLELGRFDLGSGKSAGVAWLRGTALSKVVAPPHWKPNTMRQLTEKEVSEECEFLGTEEGMDVFRDKTTGEVLYVGRTQKGAPPAHISRDMIQERFDSLSDELAQLGALENTPSGDYRGDLASLRERAKQLVEDTQASEPGPLQLQGIAARLLNEWEEAASLFRRVTELRPEYLYGWLELTWSLAALRRFEEAECAARTALELRPENASALGNLAAVLLNQGKIEEARVAAERAVMADPKDAKNQAVFAAVKKAAAKGKPWWRRIGRG